MNKRDEASMAQGPASIDVGRHKHYQTRSISRRSKSADSRAFKQQTASYQPVGAKTQSVVDSCDSDRGLSRRTGSGGGAYSESYGVKLRNSGKNGAPEMGIKSIEMENSSVIQTVEIFKNPGQTLGFYIREGNGFDRQEGVFISRIQAGTVAESNGLLHIGDEILSVNSVEVSRMSLDDVVILMSIPRKLLLKIRSKKNCNKKNASCPSLALTESDNPPVVVLKKGHVRASSDTQLEMTEKIPHFHEGGMAADTNSDLFGRRFHRPEKSNSQYASIFISPHKAEAKLISGGDDNNSDHSSEGSIPRSIDSGGKDYYSGHRGYSVPIGPPEDPYGYLAPSSLPNYPLPLSDSMEKEYGRIISPHEQKYMAASQGHTRSPSRGSTLSQAVPTSRPRYYSSDSERGAYSDTYQPLSDYGVGYRAGYTDSASRQKYQGAFREMIHSKAKYGGKSRPRSPECYNSDSEVLYTTPSCAVNTPDPRGFASDYETYAGAISDDDPVYAVPKQISASSSSELQLLLRKFTTLSQELQQEQNRLQQQLTTRDKQVTSSTNSVYSAAGSNSFLTKSLSPVPLRKVTSATQTPKQQQQRVEKLFRKQSADSLTSYKTYQLDEPCNSIDPIAQEPKYSRPVMYTSSKGIVKGVQTVTTSSSSISNLDPSMSFDTNGRAITRTSASRFRDLQLAKRPLQISYGDFDCYKIDLKKRNEFSRSNGLDGVLCVHVLCGQGLKCTKMTLRDLYCVISVDSLNKARTMVRTGAVNFDWDEAFDIDLENAKDVSFLIYNWDPNYKHRLCFHGSIFLPGFTDPNRKKHVALKMEPKGLLYVTLLYREPKEILQRLPNVKHEGCFGVDLDTVIKRENINMHVPLLVVKSVAEIERRGLDVVGIYRLCGSSRRKSQLREAFEKNSAQVDLSPENVSDIHVVTGVLKDYLRELPEPLVTNALYQMMLDALSVRLPGDPDGSAKLMLSILECLPKSNQDTMSLMLNHLHKIAAKSERNKMGLDQLATCLGPVLLCPSSVGAASDTMEFRKHIDVLKYLLEVWGEKLSTEGSKPSSSATSPRSDNSIIHMKPNNTTA
ncbi:rho GTPase-activating protein SYDE2-like [Dreissena polymorpha]|uniref:rho GTPase-activating protein SYDE2-like n=1 Tax=Dreissena polymorpha TaxID=45954 RepID=UPI002263CFFA|nr:rho GTPase-activating protein SYDE2-like [Dreissena polymorpha]